MNTDNNPQDCKPLNLTHATTNLLYALRTFNDVETFYYCYLTERFGEKRGDEMYNEDKGDDNPFDKMREFIEHEIAEVVRDWSVSLDLSTEV